jgi:hypothetical protein
MAQNERLTVTDLDFDDIKASLKRFLNSQSEYTDYDFESSGLSVLLDVLAYNTHYQSFYLNMIANESFLDTASSREALVSLAKGIGYTPRSVTGAIAYVNLQFNPNDLGGEINGEASPISRLGTEVTIPKGSVFTTELSDKTYSFVTTDSYVARPVANTTGGYWIGDTASSGIVPYVATDVKITQGVFSSAQYIYNSQLDQQYIIPSTGVDTSTITVLVTDSISTTSTKVYTKADNYTNLDGDSLVFFISEGADQRFEIYFGDGVIGKKPLDGSIIDITYAVPEPEAGNGATVFKSDAIRSPFYGIGGSTITYSPSVSTVINASGGRDRQTAESIRFLAPLNYESQNRVVTKQDYVTAIRTEYPQVETVSVWGGEEDNVPIYGNVYVAIKPTEGYFLSSTEKRKITDQILKPKSVFGITPIIVDPEYIYLKIVSNITWNPRLTGLTEYTLRNGIRQEILDFGDIQLEKFDEPFRYSPFTSMIDDYDSGIVGNLTTIQMRKQFKPLVGTSSNYTIDFDNRITPGEMTSSNFTYNGYTGCTLSDQSGTINIIAGSNNIIAENIGTIDYTTGVVNINAFNPTSIGVGGFLSIIVTPRINDVFVGRGKILTIISDDLTLTMQQET